MTDALVWVLAGVAVIEALGLTTLWVLLTRSRGRTDESRRATDELRPHIDAPQSLIAGGREAVKKLWDATNLLLKAGVGAAVRSSIEDLADWAEVERPDLARLTRHPQGGDPVLRHRGLDRAERADG